MFLQDRLYQAIITAIGAGKIALKIYEEYKAKSKLENYEVFDRAYALKADNSPITMADIESNNHITQRLSTMDDYEICSEEGVLDYAIRRDLEAYWLVDPLDGTKDFLAGIGEWTINIALVKGNQVSLGVVCAPCVGRLYFAEAGCGSFSMDLSPLRGDEPSQEYIEQNSIRLYGGARKAKHEARLLACDSRFHSAEKTEAFIEKYGLDTLRLGSSLKICALASGQADIYPRFNGTKEWDTAASDIILRESGGLVIDYESKQPLLYNKENLENNHFIAFGSAQIGNRIYQDLLSGNIL